MKEKKQITSLGIEPLYAGVEAVFISRTSCIFHLVICRRRKGSLEIVVCENDLDIETIKKKLKKASQVHLVVTGKPVVHKKLSRFYENAQELTGTLLPDAKQTEFVAQCAEANGLFYGAVIRKDVLHETIKPFSEASIFPQTVLLGPAVLYALTNLPDGNTTYVSTTVYDLHAENARFDFASSTGENRDLTIGTEKVNSIFLPALCACLQAQTQYPAFSLPDDPEIKKAMGEAVQKKRFKKIMVSLVVSIFLITTANFFMNRVYSQRHNTLDEQLALNRQMLGEIEKLEKDIGEKKSLLGKRPGTTGPVISFIGDRLAATVPMKIRLQNLEIFPLEGKIAKEKPIGFSFGKVIVEGVTAESDVLDEWIGKCKKFEWVKDVLIVKYNFDREKRKGWFRLELLLK